MFENLSASYDVGVAKKYGINSAVLLNKLIYLQKYTSRNDGYCWRSAKELEDELGLSRYQQESAIKKLEDAGILETKNTYIIGTQVKCKHFKIIGIKDTDMVIQETSKSDFKETSKSEMRETSKSVNNNNTIIIKHNNNIYRDIKFKKPTLEEVEEYCKSRNNNVDAKSFYEYFEAGGWKDSQGKQVKNWKQKVITWENYSKKKTSEIEPSWLDKDLSKELKISKEEELELKKLLEDTL
jgi:hypothetical protein